MCCFSVQAQDNLQVYSPALGVNILFCTGCTGHGSCDYTEIRIDDSATGARRAGPWTASTPPLAVLAAVLA